MTMVRLILLAALVASSSCMAPIQQLEGRLLTAVRDVAADQEAARAAMEQQKADLDRRLRDGQIELAEYQRRVTELLAGRFDAVRESWGELGQTTVDAFGDVKQQLAAQWEQIKQLGAQGAATVATGAAGAGLTLLEQILSAVLVAGAGAAGATKLKSKAVSEAVVKTNEIRDARRAMRGEKIDIAAPPS